MECKFSGPRFWGLDPVFSSKAKFNICDILSLKHYSDFQDVYCILNHPIMTVHILGDVVSIVRKSRLITYEVDDGTAVIGCCQWRKADDSDDGIFIPKLGQLVSVFGKLSEFRAEKQLTVSSIYPENDPNVEPLFWLEVAQLKRNVYSKPFVLPDGVPDTEFATLSAEDLQDMLHAELQHYLESNFANKRFTLPQLKSERFIESCFQTIKEVSPSTSKDYVRREVTSLVTKLPLKGIVISVLRQQDRDTIYKIFSEAEHLHPHILRYMKRREESPKTAKLGIPEDWIVEHVKQSEDFCQLPKSKIVAGINSLVENSQIYVMGPKTYKRAV